MRPLRPDLRLLWPSYTLFPLIGLGVLVTGVGVGDGAMVAIGIALLAFNALVVLNYAYFTSLGIENESLVHRTGFGTQVERVPIGAIQRIDAKRYAGAHSGVSAPYFVARGRDTTVKVNTRPYRLAEFAGLLAVLRRSNARVELDPFWDRVARGEEVSKEAALTPTGRF
jgi:hypothetical protein